MTEVDRTQVREFRDPNGVRWQILSGRVVKRWDVGTKAWVDSSYTLRELEGDPEIREVTPVGGDV